MIEYQDNFQIRDFFSKTNIEILAARLVETFPEFQYQLFLRVALEEIEISTYSERKTRIIDAFSATLPTHFPDALKILLKVLPEPYESLLPAKMERFMVAPMAEYVSIYGLSYPNESLNGLYYMTKSFTSEWGIRPFLQQHKTLAFEFLHKWVEDSDPHVRRLVSEGTRPYLPWGKKLVFVEKDPETTLPLLRKLKDDESEYVRRSVANHLNDFTKKHPEKIIKELAIWTERSQNKNTEKLIRHALRTSVKNGHSAALSLLGYAPDIKVDIQNLSFTRSVPFSGKFEFEFNMISEETGPVKVMLDFIIHYRKANGSTQPKVFKLRDFSLTPGTFIQIKKMINFKPITTRKYYAGRHYLQLLVNGNPGKKYEFQLEDPGTILRNSN